MILIFRIHFHSIKAKGNLAIISLSCLFWSKFSRCDLCNHIRPPSLFVLSSAMIQKSFGWLISGVFLTFFFLLAFVLWDLHCSIGLATALVSVGRFEFIYYLLYCLELGWKNLMFHILFMLYSMDIIIFLGHKQCAVFLKVADCGAILPEPLFNQPRKKKRLLKNLLIILRGIAKTIK